MGTLGSAIAIDDISIKSGNCGGNSPQNTSFRCLPTTQLIPKNKVCDGVKDCVNGADELDCGSCMFTVANKDDCGFTESIPGIQ